MAKRVRAEQRLEARLARVAFEDLPEADACEPWPAAARVHEESRARTPAKERFPPLPGIAAHPPRPLVADRHQPLLVALAGARQEGRLEIQVGRPQPHEL